MRQIDQTAWAAAFARWVLGLTFFMAGWWKTWELTPAGHAERFFLGQFTETWIPVWLLWALGVAIPVVELAAGALVILGLARRPAYLALGVVLVIVTYGHLLIEPLFSLTGHIFVRLALLLFVMMVPIERDRLALDVVRNRRGAAGY